MRFYLVSLDINIRFFQWNQPENIGGVNVNVNHDIKLNDKAKW